jgi:hypothetical protein
VQTTSETGVDRWRNHTKAPRQLFHRHLNAAFAKRGNKKRTGMEMEGRLVVERRMSPDQVGRWLAFRIHRSVDLKRGEQGSTSLRLRAVSGRGSLPPAKDRENSRGCHARPLEDRHRHAKSLCDGTFHSRYLMLIVMLNVTNSVDWLRVFFVCHRGSAYVGPLRARPMVRSDLHACSEEVSQHDCAIAAFGRRERH